MRASYNGDTFANIIIKASNSLNRQMTLNDFTRYDYFLIQKASPNWILIGGSVAASRHPDSYTNTLADARIAPWARSVGATGTAPPVRLGTGTADTGTFLRGDGTWAAAGGGGTAYTDADVDARVLDRLQNAPNSGASFGDRVLVFDDGNPGELRSTQWGTARNYITSLWAQPTNSDIVPSAKLAAGGTADQVLTRTGTGQVWGTLPTGSPRRRD